MSGQCRYPEHHRGGSGFPFGLVAVIIGAVIIGTSATFAAVMHDVMVAILAVCATVTVLGVAALWVLTGRLARTDFVPRQLPPVKVRAEVVKPEQAQLPAPGPVVAVDGRTDRVTAAALTAPSARRATYTVKRLGPPEDGCDA
jgi:hypothetical protein